MSCNRFQVKFTKQALKDTSKLSPKLKAKLKAIIKNKISFFPEDGKPLVGELKGCYSVRLSFQDRIAYRIESNICVVVIIRTKTHYGE